MEEVDPKDDATIHVIFPTATLPAPPVQRPLAAPLLIPPPSIQFPISGSSLPTSANKQNIIPSQTLYVHNLNEKISLLDLKQALYLLFGNYGNVLDIQARRTKTLRGQAWVVLDSLQSAARALAELNSFEFYKKPLKIEFARSESDALLKAKGIPIGRAKRKKDKGEAKEIRTYKTENDTEMKETAEDSAKKRKAINDDDAQSSTETSTKKQKVG